MLRESSGQPDDHEGHPRCAVPDTLYQEFVLGPCRRGLVFLTDLVVVADGVGFSSCTLRFFPACFPAGYVLLATVSIPLGIEWW